MRRQKRVICGVGINDADYCVQPRVNGKIQTCPFYSKWAGIIRRCYSPLALDKNPSYIGCTVDEQWLKFSVFKAWMEGQDWEGKEIDKDLLIPNNKRYGPVTCVFVDGPVNKFLTDHAAARGKHMLGVFLDKRHWKFRASCSNPFTGKLEFLGHFMDELSAHLAWRQRKHEHACQLADLQTNHKVANALRNRFAPELLGDNF